LNSFKKPKLRGMKLYGSSIKEKPSYDEVSKALA
jgi:hypothetical protein